MPEGYKKAIPAHRGRIELDDADEIRWWCGKLGCSDIRLREAVRAVGTSATKVAQYLRERKILSSAS